MSELTIHVYLADSYLSYQALTSSYEDDDAICTRVIYRRNCDAGVPEIVDPEGVLHDYTDVVITPVIVAYPMHLFGIFPEGCYFYGDGGRYLSAAGALVPVDYRNYIPIPEGVVYELGAFYGCLIHD